MLFFTTNKCNLVQQILCYNLGEIICKKECISMLQTIQSRDITTKFPQIAAQAIAGVTFVVARPHNRNLVVMSEKQHQQLLRALNNAQMDKKLDQGQEEIKKGLSVEMSFEQLGIER